jgi:hypothetical protein
MSKMPEQADSDKFDHSDDKFLLPKITKSDRTWLKSQRVITLATIITALATATYAFVTIFQWKALSKQVSALEDQVTIMDAQLRLTSEQLNLLRQSLKLTEASNENVTVANRLAGRSLLETQKSVVIAQKSLELSEEAAVSVQAVMMEPIILAADKEFTVTFVLINKGRTNALNPIKSGYVTIGTEKNHSGKDSQPLLGGPPIAPDIPVDVNFMSGGLPQQVIDAINNGAVRLYANVNVTFTDVFSKTHQFEECRYYEPKLKQFVYCHLHSRIIK